MRDRFFDALASLVNKRPWIIMLVALVLLAAAGAVSGNLKMETRILDLMPKDDPAATEFEEIVRQYSSASQIMIGIEGGDRKAKVAFAEEIGKRATEAKYTSREDGSPRPYIKRVTVKSDVDFIREHGLMLSKESDLRNTEELFTDLELPALLSAYNDFLEREYIEDTGAITEREKEDRAIDGLKSIVQWLEGIELAAGGEGAAASHADHVSDLLSAGEPYLISEDDSMLIVSAVPTISVDRMEETMEGAASLRDVIEDIRSAFPDLRFRMTGMPVLSLEEGEVAMGDMGISSLVSLVLVLGLFVLAFRMWTAPILAIINLLVGIVWATGFIALVFGRLNLMTLMFAVILIGLGIDFAIHLNAAYATARSEGKSVHESLRAMYRRSGSGVITGALTTAAAFFALALTGMEAFIELGVLLGAGILLTLISSMTVLPAMYVIHERIGKRLRGGKERPVKPVRLAFPFLSRMGEGISRRPIVVALLMLALTGGAVWIARGAEFEGDMLEMEPPDMPSVTLHREILDKFEVNPDYTMVTASDVEEARKIVKKMKKNRLVGMVDSISELLPPEKDQKKRAGIVARIGERMREYQEPRVTVGLPGVPALAEPPEYMTREKLSGQELKVFYNELDRLQMNVQEIGQLAFTSVKLRLHRSCERLTGGDDPRFSAILGVKKRVAALDDPGRAIADYQRAYIPRLASRMEEMADTTPITLESLPPEISQRYLSAEGNNLVTIYSSVDLYKDDKIDLFIAATSKVSDRVTGTVILMDRLVDLVGHSGTMAVLFALVAVFVILLIDFRHLGYALLGMVPLVTGFVWMIALFVLVGWKFDVANVGAIPLILGIGIDDAVHLLHAVRREGIGRLPDILKHTGRALILTSLTTGIAFGSIAFASHVGMAGMGVLLVLGVASCLVTSLVLLPAMARIFLRDKESNTVDKEVAQ